MPRGYAEEAKCYRDNHLRGLDRYNWLLQRSIVSIINARRIA